jgi:Lecithin retinol acyltransferase
MNIMAKGDHIRVNRYGGIISHHGIDMGDGSVVHFRKDDSGNKAIVGRTSIADFAKGGTVKTVQHQMFDHPDVVVSRAGDLHRLQREGRLNSYHFLDRNCEHLATSCKTGEFRSDQAEGARAGAQSAARSASRYVFSVAMKKLFGG